MTVFQVPELRDTIASTDACRSSLGCGDDRRFAQGSKYLPPTVSHSRAIFKDL